MKKIIEKNFNKFYGRHTEEEEGEEQKESSQVKDFSIYTNFHKINGKKGEEII